MALNWQGLGFLFTAKDMATAVIGRIERSLGTLGPAAARAGKAMAGAFVAAGGAAAGMAALKGTFALAKDASAFEQALGLLNATAGATREEMRLFDDKAMKIGLTSIHGPKAAADGMAALVSGGMKAAQAIKSVDDALLMATASAGQLTTDEIGTFLSNLGNAFPEAADTNRVVNMAAQLANLSSVSFRDIPTMYAKAGNAMNQSMAEMSALMGAFKNSGVGPEEAATSARMVTLAFAQPKKVKAFEEATGVEVFDKQTGKFRNVMTEVMAEMATSPQWNALGENVQTGLLAKIFESRQVAKVMSTLNQITRKGFEDPVTKAVTKGQQGVDDLVKSYNDAQKNNAAKRFEEEQLGIFGGALKRFEAAAESIRTIFGRAFGNAFKPILEALSGLFSNLGQILNSISPETRNAAAAFAVAGIAAFTLSMGIGLLVTSFMVMKFVLGLVGGVLFAFLIKPMLIAMGVIGVFILVGAAFYAAWKNNLYGLQDLFGGFFNKIKLGVEAITQLFTTGGTWGEVDEALQRPENAGLQDFLMNVWMWIGRVQNFFKGMWEGFQAGLKRMDLPMESLLMAFDTFLTLLGFGKTSADQNASSFDRWGRIGESLGEVLSLLANIVVTGLAAAMWVLNTAVAAVRVGWEILGPVVTSVLSMIMNLLDIFIGVFTGNWEKAGQAIKNVFYDVMDFVIGMIGGVLKIFAVGIDALTGSKWDLFGQLDKSMDEASVQQITKHQSVGATGGWAAISPAKAALQTQVEAAPNASMMPAPVVNVNVSTPPVVLDGERMNTKLGKRERSSNLRSFVPQKPVVGEL